MIYYKSIKLLFEQLNGHSMHNLLLKSVSEKPFRHRVDRLNDHI